MRKQPYPTQTGNSGRAKHCRQVREEWCPGRGGGLVAVFTSVFREEGRIFEA